VGPSADPLIGGQGRSLPEAFEHLGIKRRGQICTTFLRVGFLPHGKSIFAGTVEKMVKTGKDWQYSYIVCFILVFYEIPA